LTIVDGLCLKCNKKRVVSPEKLKEAVEIREWRILEAREKERKKNISPCPFCKKAVPNPTMEREIECDQC